MLADRLQIGDEIRIVAPSMSMSILKGAQLKIATERLTAFGFNITYGNNTNCYDDFYTGTIAERITDLHDAFTDKNVKAIICATGGFQANQLLSFIDYDLIKKNKKIFCGIGDNTFLNLAIYTKTALKTYYGPNFASFGSKFRFDYTMESFLSAVTNDSIIEIVPSEFWSEDPWHAENNERCFNKQSNYTVLSEGRAGGKVIGGNLSALALLKGTEFMPNFKNAILFIEDDEQSHPFKFERDLQALLHSIGTDSIVGLLIGRFQAGSAMTTEALKKIVLSKNELCDIPIVANVNIGHVDPVTTIPIGSKATITATHNRTEILIEQL